jgi:hypothetical protein
MPAGFPIIKCSKCSSDMRVGVIQAIKNGNVVTYECLRCDGGKTVIIPGPKDSSDKPQGQK